LKQLKLAGVHVVVVGGEDGDNGPFSGTPGPKPAGRA
jgi:hypothetical protein